MRRTISAAAMLCAASLAIAACGGDDADTSVDGGGVAVGVVDEDDGDDTAADDAADTDGEDEAEGSGEDGGPSGPADYDLDCDGPVVAAAVGPVLATADFAAEEANQTPQSVAACAWSASGDDGWDQSVYVDIDRAVSLDAVTREAIELLGLDVVEDPRLEYAGVVSAYVLPSSSGEAGFTGAVTVFGPDYDISVNLVFVKQGTDDLLLDAVAVLADDLYG